MLTLQHNLSHKSRYYFAVHDSCSVGIVRLWIENTEFVGFVLLETRIDCSL
jgi:hypothetical protein